MKSKTILSYLIISKAKTVAFVCLVILLSFTAPYKSYVMQWIIDANGVDELFRMLLLGGIIFVLTFIFEWLCRNIFASMNNTAADKIRKDTVDGLLKRNYSDYYNEPTGNYISLLINDIRTIQDDYYQSIFNIALYGGMLLFALIFLFSINPIFFLVALITGIFPICLPRFFAKSLKRTRKESSEKIAQYSGFIKDTFHGFDTIRIFGAFNQFSMKNKVESKELESKETAYKRTLNANISVSSFLNNVLFFIIMAIGIVLVFQGKLTIGYMVTATNLSNFTLQPFQVISQSISLIISTKEIRRKIENAVKTENSIADEDNKQLLSDGNIRINSVDFKYNTSKNYVLKNFNTQIDAKKKYAVVGESGSGKSTIAKLLCKFYTPNSGNITIDGININSISAPQYTDTVLMITQQPYIFNDSIYNNITLYENTFTNDEINAALVAAGLEKFIESLPNRLDTQVTENGKNLSGGQLQRIAIARAMLRNPKILIADEPTSSLDEQTAIGIENALLQLPSTVIMITHHLHEQVLEQFDDIFYVKNGNFEKNLETL